ncbi:PREDICTED: peptidyl-prolyl cis-trans isomerase FKBP17-1, chloroplastic isoform X2 [Erythranthe guttata]|uniref:peptidyl-prolyl cis-trans isomerase FKBP17-1, chloroplastic isoform X2 n=1 Tax=Erythranthe guttata TaxID=4155 RepID=UPI00064DBAC5|nr:PREDICTED: peptidyl-prolyl cis-trans isomerase FKBP17-1, chloroplastic isoform X2 [Erythranthe guttata]|eukprot:XP_012847384.1 PREDICTED: peptidyl-prolyl cis-trans isomerase FKBP17-1, chloroplastic isoform X2 [Erythranthe guttata]
MIMALQLQCNAYNLHFPTHPSLPSTKIFSAAATPLTSSRRALSLFAITGIGLSNFGSSSSICSWYVSDFVDLPNSGGVKALELRIGDGETPLNGDKVIIHYYGRLAAKQGWRFDSTYDHKDANGEPVPFEFVLGSGKFFDRQRLFTTIFNPTRLANGEGSTLGIIIFDIELLSLRRH